MSKFSDDIAAVINRYSMENESNTPDFILANYLDACLTTFQLAVRERDAWHRDKEAPLDG